MERHSLRHQKIDKDDSALNLCQLRQFLRHRWVAEVGISKLSSDCV